MALDLTKGQHFYLVIETDCHGTATPVRLVSEDERLIYVSEINRFHRRTGVEARAVPVELPSFDRYLPKGGAV